MNKQVKRIESRWPDFIIAGAAKSGTTALHNFLDQHPEIFMSRPKEPNFFLFSGEEPEFSDIESDEQLYRSSVGLYERIKKNSITDEEAYLKLFDQATSFKVKGEASVLYLSDPKAPARIKKYIPDVKLIVMLRNPVDRAFSSYMHMVLVGNETRSFKEALQQEPVDAENIWCGRGDYYIRAGFYARQLKGLFKHFDQQNIRIYLFDDFISSPEAIMSDIYRFLGVDESFQGDHSKKLNISGVPKSKFIYNSLTRLYRKFASTGKMKKMIHYFLPKKTRSKITAAIFERSLNKPKMSQEDKEKLLSLYRKEILELQTLLDKDLTRWLNPS